MYKLLHIYIFYHIDHSFKKYMTEPGQNSMGSLINPFSMCRVNKLSNQDRAKRQTVDTTHWVKSI